MEAQPFLVSDREGENREAHRQVVLHPGGEFGSATGIVSDDLLEPQLGGRTIGAVKDAADGAGDFGWLIQPRDMGLGVLQEMELAPLPRQIST